MSTIRLFVRDIRFGTMHKLFLFLFPILLAYMQTKDSFVAIEMLRNGDWIDHYGTVGDYFMLCMRGMEIYHFDPKTTFTVPVYWFMFHIFLSYITAYYVHDDYKEYGTSVMIASRKKASFWDAKCLWCFLTVILYYGVYFLSVTFFSMYRGAKLSFYYSKDFATKYFGNEITRIVQKSY